MERQHTTPAHHAESTALVLPSQLDRERRLKLLLVEDDKALGQSLSANLTLSGYVVDWLQTLAHAQAALDMAEYDAIILDLNLPDGDGLSLLHQQRHFRKTANQTVPILVLSARSDLDDRVIGLNLGADDYLVKPFELSELEARLRVIIRRRNGMINNQLKVGPLRLDLHSQQVWLEEMELPLTHKEFLVLEALACRCDQIVSKQVLMEKLSSLDQDATPNAVDIAVHRTRKKLGQGRVQIRTLRGFGYMLEIQS